MRTLPVLAEGTRGIVTSPHVLASREGQRILREGGNSIEAAIAMGAVLAIVYPHFCGLGGDAVWLVADERGASRCFLGIGQASRNAAGYESGVPLRGPRSAATTACVVDSWGHAHTFSAAWGNAFSVAGLLDSAIGLAEEGIPVSASQHFWLEYRKDEWPTWPGFGTSFDTGSLGKTPFRQPQLGRSLRIIADNGPRSFYEGDLAASIADGLAAAGAPVDATDLAATRTRESTPTSLEYAGHTLLAPPSPTQGVTTLMIMGILERLGIGCVAEGSSDFYHLLVEAIKQSFLLRGGIADPDGATQPVTEWLAPDALQRLAMNIDRSRALPWSARFQTGDTVYLAAVDAKGRCASMLQSIYFDWGSGVVAGDTGILWQNRAAAFTSGPNALRPGARPFYTLNPGIALKDGRPRMLYGTQGADGQPQTLATLLTRAIDFGMDPAAALAAPRFLLGRTFSDSRDNLKLEDNIGDAVMADLQARGHETAPLPRHSPISGQAGLIVLDGRRMSGAHDPRSDGVAMGWM